MARLVRKRTAAPPDPDFMPQARRIAELAAGHKGVDIQAYDVRGLTLIADSFVICSARSEPQIKAIHNAVSEGMKEVGVPPLRTEGTFKSGWLVMDYGAVIFHVFREEARSFYDLEDLWGDAPKIPLDID